MTDLEHIQAYFERHCARLPDPVGLRVYVEHLTAGTSLQTLEAAIANSEEARRVAVWRRITGKTAPETEAERVLLESIVLAAVDLPQAPEPAAPAPTASVVLSEAELFLNSVYLAILGRRPDDSGLRGYLEAIRQGLPLNQIITDILSSDESRQVNGSSKALERARSLRSWAKLPLLKRLCNGMATAVLAQEYVRLWNRRMPRGQQG